MLPFVPLSLWLAISAADYAGAAACRSCHASEFEVQSVTAHARALSPSKPGQPGEWAFGSGMRAITFVRRLDPEYYLEESESWYRARRGYARTPMVLVSTVIATVMDRSPASEDARMVNARSAE